MTTTEESRSRKSGIAQVIDTSKDLARLQAHLETILAGDSFRNSQRCSEFLKFIIHQAATGQLEMLKERMIGVEVFGRLPTYDTGEDAIVRVTASDVRKRLVQHYRLLKSPPEFHISLPPGGYLPEITQHTRPQAELAPAPQPGRLFFGLRMVRKVVERYPLHFSLALALCGVLIGAWGFYWISRARAASAQLVYPWSEVFSPQRRTLVVTSDPNLAEIVGLTHSPVSVSDYANQRYAPDHGKLSPDVQDIIRNVLRGDKAANVDVEITLMMAQIARQNAASLHVRPARDLHLSDLDTDNNFIFIGSIRTNPWASLFEGEFDFRFVSDTATGMEIVQNLHPHRGEPATYVPTAKGLATGESYALLSYVQNLNHSGQVLLVAGASAEGTKAAGELAANTTEMVRVLHGCGVSRSGPYKHFQLVVQVNTMAGSPMQYQVASCHALP
jgi:hypothetical protein